MTRPATRTGPADSVDGFDRINPEPAVSTPGSLIVTFAGLHLRNIGGWIAVADLIALLRPAGAQEAAVRQALVRLKTRGFLRTERRHDRAGYRLTDTATADLESGDTRIFRFGEAAESDGWVLAIFSVPEQARSERHRLRSQLVRLGFGTVGPGVWIAPAALAQRSRRQLDGQGLGGYISWFTAQNLEPAQVARWWDLAALQALYEQFLLNWEPQSTQGWSGEQAFSADLLLVDEWRQFPRIDPGLPAALLPEQWNGRRAFEVFSALRELWSGAALDHVAERVGG